MFKVYVFGFFIIAFSSASHAQLPAGTSLLSDGMNAFIPLGPGTKDSIVKAITVSNQSFNKALLINTFNTPSPGGEYGLVANSIVPLHKGDVLWISFKARSLESKRESGEAMIELRFDQLVNGKYAWPPHFERSISIGNNWTETSIPFVMKKDAAVEDVRLIVMFGSYPERLEMGPITFVNYGQSVKLENLPKSIVHYEGDAPDAAWRKDAEARIDKYRKGNMMVKVTDEKGKPVPGAMVTVKQTKNAFGWGTATNSTLLLDTLNSASKKYRDTLLAYFNKVVFENEVKSKNWAKANHQQTIKAVGWLKAHNMVARGHVMVWPSFNNSPQLLPYKNDTGRLRAAILNEITDETTVLKNQFVEWDVVNEPFTNHNIMDTLGGKGLMVDWFKAARKNTPGVKLFLNDFSMFHTSGSGSDSFYNNVKYLVDHGAPIEGIGEQSHIGGTPPGITFMLKTLDRFSTFGLPIQISEFDITSDDDDFKARYLKDYFTAIYSHPSTIGILQWGFWAGSHWIPSAALWDKDWNIKPEGEVFTQLVSKTWNTAAEGISSQNGNYALRGFTGNYEVTVKYKGRERKQQATLTTHGTVVFVKL